MVAAYIQALQRKLERERAEQQLQRDEEVRAAAQAVREKLVPLESGLARLLNSIPIELQREGLSLPSQQASLRARWRGSCHPGEKPRILRSNTSLRKFVRKELC
jgi:hypothetical protein